MKAWEELLVSLESDLGADAVAQWLRPIRVARFDAANLYLEPTTPFQQSWFKEHVQPRLGKRFVNNNQRPIRIHWNKSGANEKNPQKPLAPRIIANPLEPGMTLETFLAVDGSPNATAKKIALQICQTATPPFNPILFYGPKGSGKTHLLTAITQGLKSAGRRAFFIRAETFMEHVVQAIRLGFMQDFRKTYRDIDALIVDDIHTFARRAATQEEFFHTFNTLHTMGRPIILSSHTPPGQLAEIEPRLISRFEWGVALKLEKPDTALLRQILESKARLFDLSLSPETIAFLLDRFPSASAAIEALQALALRSSRSDDPPEILLRDLLDKQHHEKLSSDKVIKQTAAKFGIRTEDLKGKSQAREFVKPRQAAMYLCRKILSLPFEEIGRIFDRDHSTVMSSVKQIEKILADPKNALALEVEQILKNLEH